METTTEIETRDDEALKKRLLKRIAVATVILAGLLGCLLIFDDINAPKPPAGDRAAALPPVAEPPPAARESIAKESATEPSAAADKSAPSVATVEQGVPERSASPGADSLPPLPGEKPLTKPATGRLAVLHPAEPSQPVASRLEPAREVARTKPPPSASDTTHRLAEPNPASRPERRFGLQLGVFSNLANAEELRARLTRSGIPATIEARVQVGPFASRAEADAARAKLKELGIADSLLISMKSRAAP